MKETLSGWKEKGSWSDIVKLGEMISEAFDEENVDSSERDEWEEWRPKNKDTNEKDVSERTAEQASIEKGEGEKKDISPAEDVKEATENVKQATEKSADGDIEEAGEQFEKAAFHAGRAADSSFRKAVRAIEEVVFEKIMTQVSPYYFDNTLLNANLYQERDGTFSLEVNINDDDLYERLRPIIERYDSEERWHSDAVDEQEVERTMTVEGPSTGEESIDPNEE